MRRVDVRGGKREKYGEKEIMMKLVATTVVACQPPERQPTAMLLVQKEKTFLVSNFIRSFPIWRG